LELGLVHHPVPPAWEVFFVVCDDDYSYGTAYDDGYYSGRDSLSWEMEDLYSRISDLEEEIARLEGELEACRDGSNG
jgi:hypothetical protein